MEQTKKRTLAAALEALAAVDAADAAAPLEEALEAFKTEPLAVTPDAVDALWGPARRARDAWLKSLTDYENDLKSRQGVLDQQAQALDAQISQLNQQIAALESRSREAASRGDLDTAAQADEEAEGLRRQAAAASRKRRIASSTELQGDGDLFAAIRRQRAAYDAAFDLCKGYVIQAVAVIDEWKTDLEALEKQTRWTASRGPVCNSYDVKRWEAIDRNFNRDDYQNRETRQTAELARKQAGQDRRKAIADGRLVIVT